MRTTLNIKASTPAEFKAALRSLAAKVDSDALVPGADFKVSGVRVQVATPRVADIRAFALENDIPVGTRGRFSKDLQERYDAHVKAQKAQKRAEAKARREAKAQESVSA